MDEHELATFLMQDLSEMQSEYRRIRARTVEDPGTAGDEGEEAWAAVLRDWLPDSYEVRCKGRILGSDGAAGPQVDIVVLRPGYPRRLLDKKLYLAGGVAAAFECKNTLTSSHIKKTWESVAAVNSLQSSGREGTPYRDLVPEIFFGLLAHGHSWDKEGSQPVRVITEGIAELVNSTDRMRDALSLLCVANLASWDVLRTTYDGPGLMPADIWEARKKLLSIDDDRPVCAIQYNLALSDVSSSTPANPLGVLVSNLVGRLAFENSALRPLSQYFFASGMGGARGIPVVLRQFLLADQYAPQVCRSLPHSLTNGQPGSEWEMGYNF